MLARRLGFDGIEIHGAHGYLLDQFFWAATNHRTDDYGVTLRRRAAFPARVVAAVREAVGPDFPIIYRFSQWKGVDYTARIAANPGELEELPTPLVDAGVDLFHTSLRRHWLPDGSLVVVTATFVPDYADRARGPRILVGSADRNRRRPPWRHSARLVP